MTASHIDRYAVMGNPIEHSKSPLIHKIFAERTHQTLSYEKILVPLDSFKTAVDAFWQAGGKGLNITVPFKTQAFSYVNDASKVAKLAHSVNTIIFINDEVCFGENTDGVGLVRDLEQNKKIMLQGKKILLLGAGGAVRGCVLPLLQAQPSNLTICNRDINKAHAIKADFSAYKNLSICTYEDLYRPFDIIINGTSASLQNDLPPIPDSVLFADSCCYDMGYGKQMTPFQRWASERGVKDNYDGLGMLIEQAAESFYLWRGVRPNTLGIEDELR